LRIRTSNRISLIKKGLIIIPKKTTDITTKNKPKSKSHQNRGLKFEQLISDKLMEYRKEGKCFIQKIPTEFTIIRAGARVISAFPKKQTESCDFLGSIQYLPIGIESKETQNKTSFPLSNIEPHQLEFFKNWCGKQGVGYYLVRFSILNRIFLVNATSIENEINTRSQKTTQEKGDKSLTLQWFEDNSQEIDANTFDFLPYVKDDRKYK
jgi:recombination protein U